MIDLNSSNRPIQIKMRFSQAEADALATLAQVNGLSLAAQVRALLRDATNGNPKKRDHSYACQSNPQ